MIASLRARFLLVVMLGGVAPLALVGVWAVRNGPRAAEEELRARLAETLNEIVQTTGRNWVQIRSRLLNLADDERVLSLIRNPVDPDFAAGQTALAGQDLDETVDNLEFLAASGARRQLTAPPPGDGASRQAGVPVRIPVFGEPNGEMIARVQAEKLLPSDLLLSGVGGSVLAALDMEGSPVLPMPIERELLALPRFERRGEWWITVSQTLQEPPLTLVLAGPTGAVTEPLRRAARVGTLALVAGSVVALFIVWIGSGRVIRGLRSLTEASRAVAAGTLAVDVPESGPAELRNVARAFNTMSASLGQTLERATQRETLAALGEYAASLAHEVRNPITSMRLDLERVADRLETSDPSSALVHRAIDELDRLDASVSDALKLARSGRLDLLDIDVREPVEAALRAARPRFTSRKAELRTEAWPAEPVLARANAAAVEQLVLNLLLNAADALAAGGTAYISIRGTDDAVHIVVRDEGEGIPADRLVRVFEPLFSTRPEGTGLGLPIARRIARAHGGKLVLESTQGSGTTATVTLPGPLPDRD